MELNIVHCYPFKRECSASSSPFRACYSPSRFMLTPPALSGPQCLSRESCWYPGQRSMLNLRSHCRLQPFACWSCPLIVPRHWPLLALLSLLRSSAHCHQAQRRVWGYLYRGIRLHRMHLERQPTACVTSIALERVKQGLALPRLEYAGRLLISICSRKTHCLVPDTSRARRASCVLLWHCLGIVAVKAFGTLHPLALCCAYQCACCGCTRSYLRCALIHSVG